MSDLISRQAAIELIHSLYPSAPIMPMNRKRWEKKYKPYIEAEKALEMLPSAQLEIIRCKDCKYQDENWRRVSVRWLPCMDVRTGSNWYCGSAERGKQNE